MSVFPELQYTGFGELWTSISNYFASNQLCGERFWLSSQKKSDV